MIINPAKSTKLSLSIVMCIFIFITTGVLEAQSTSKVIGRVSSVEQGEYLPGANVYLENSSIGAATDREGEFTLFKVPKGTYTLKVSYVGYEDYSAEITVPGDGGFVGHDVQMKPTYLETSDIVVYGLREGQAKALNQQKSADNIMNVIAKEQMQRFPDLNAAEVLQRVPAIAIERDQGEGRYVLVRGTEARLNAISVNGERIASPEDEERFVGLDVISTNQIASIEVTKALTPDMDPDAIGGSVNLVTKSAFDYDRRTFNANVGGGYGDLKGDPLWIGEFSFSDLAGEDKKFGYTISANIYDSNRGSANNEMNWEDAEDTSGVNIPFALQDLELRDYTVERFRYGVSANAEYRPSIGNRYFISAMFNQRDDTEQRQRLTIKPGDFVSATESIEGEVERELKDRTETQMIYNFTGGGENHFDAFDMNYTVAYSFAEEKKPEEIDPNFVMDADADISLNLSDTDKPQYQITNLEAGFEMDPANFVLDEISYENNKNSNSDMMGALNFVFPYSLAGYPAELKFGGKVHMRNKTRKDNVWTYSWDTDGENILMSEYYYAGNNTGEFQNGDYKEFGPLVDSDKSRDFFWANKDKAGKLKGEEDYVSKYGANYNVDETVTGLYAMTTHNIGDLMVLAGLRYEMSQFDYEAYELFFDADGEYDTHNEVTGKGDENHVLPNLQLKYAVAPNTNLRAAFTSSIARPNFYDRVPYYIQNPDDEEIFKGNPDLKSTTSANFDIFAETYFSGLGVLSGGFFYKDLQNIIYLQTKDITLDGDDYDEIQKVNGKDAWLYGVEVNWNQQLTFLPGFWNGFGLYANYTWTQSETKANDGRMLTLPGQSENVANFAVSYEKYGFAGRFSVNYHGSFLAEVGGEGKDIFYDDHVQIDFSASQQVYTGLRAYLEFVNLGDEPLRYYIGETSRPTMREFYSWWMHVGLKYEL